MVGYGVETPSLCAWLCNAALHLLYLETTQEEWKSKNKTSFLNKTSREF